jgi:predicted Zn finger-like uncharacterized protein
LVITCPKCSTQYKYDEARFGSSQSKRLKCPKCSNIFEVQNPTEEEDDSTLLGTGPKGEDERNSVTDQVRVAPEQPELPELAPLPTDVRYSLAVIAGAQAGSVFKITKPRVFIGRGSNMDVQLKDAEVSRRHSMIEIRGDKVTLVDMGATNGTFVDGERVQSAELANQGEFTLGSTTMMLIITHDHEITP